MPSMVACSIPNTVSTQKEILESQEELSTGRFPRENETSGVHFTPYNDSSGNKIISPETDDGGREDQRHKLTSLISPKYNEIEYQYLNQQSLNFSQTPNKNHFGLELR